MRAAVVGGGAYAVGKRSARRQDEVNAGIQEAQTQAQQAQQMAAQTASTPRAAAGQAGISEEDIARLKQLAELHESGVLTDAEFEQEKNKILGG